MSRRLVGDPDPCGKPRRKGHRGGSIPSFGAGPSVPRAPSGPATIEAQLAALRIGQMCELRATDQREMFGRLVSVDPRAICLQPLGWRGQRLTVMRDAIEGIAAATLTQMDHRIIAARQSPHDGIGDQPWPQRYTEEP